MQRFILFAVLFLSKVGLAQTYHANYKVVSRIGSEKIGFPVSLVVYYEVWANENFIEINGYDDSLYLSPQQSNLHTHSSQEHVIISIKDSLVFYVNEKKFARVKNYDVASLSKIGRRIVATLKNNHAVVRFDREIPASVTPGMFVNGLKEVGGLEQLNADLLSITLIGKIKRVNKALTYEYLFDVDKNSVNAYFDFF